MGTIQKRKKLIGKNSIAFTAATPIAPDLVIALNLFASFFCVGFVHRFMASFLYCLSYRYHSPNYRNINSCFNIIEDRKK